MTVGIDARLKNVGELYDLEINLDGDIRSEDFFDTAIIVSLFAEKRANESEVLEPLLRRGWIGNEVTPNFEIGSKIWLYEQSRLTNAVLNGIITTARQSLQWLVDDGFAVSIDDVEAIITATGINLTVTIRRPNSKVEKRYYTLWDSTALPAQPQISPNITLTRDISFQSIFTILGSPNDPVNVVITIANALYPNYGGAAITIGGPWHEDTKITLIINSGSAVAGGGGRGGGGGAASNGLGGITFGTAADGSAATDTSKGLGAVGVSGNGGATADQVAENGEDGFAAIIMGHDMVIKNNGSIRGGGGGGGGGGEDEGAGGDGGTLISGGGAGGGTGGGTAGSRGNAITKNGFEITFDPEGTISGSVV